jgi:hypothetical protein
LVGPGGPDRETRRVAITTAAAVDTDHEFPRDIPLFRCCLVRDTESEAAGSGVAEPITQPAELVKVVEPLFEGADREIFVALALDARHHPIGTNIISLGTFTA